jgi:hypothetical protein
MRRVVLSVLLVLASGFVVAAPAPFEKPERRSGLDQIQGEWEVVSHERCWLRHTGNGLGLIWDAYSCGSMAVRVTGGRLVWYFRGAVTSTDAVRMGTGTLNVIDLTDVQSGRRRPGIYRLAGDALTIRLSITGKLDRPTSFDLDREGDMVYVFRRKR